MKITNRANVGHGADGSHAIQLYTCNGLSITIHTAPDGHILCADAMDAEGESILPSALTEPTMDALAALLFCVSMDARQDIKEVYETSQALERTP